MVPIHELLSRVRWDKEFAEGQFKIGYYDRIDKCIIRIHFDEIKFQKDNHFSILVYDKEGEVHEIPFHRIREVFKNDELIWHTDLLEDIDSINIQQSLKIY